MHGRAAASGDTPTQIQLLALKASQEACSNVTRGNAGVDVVGARVPGVGELGARVVVEAADDAPLGVVVLRADVAGGLPGPAIILVQVTYRGLPVTVYYADGDALPGAKARACVDVIGAARDAKTRRLQSA